MRISLIIICLVFSHTIIAQTTLNIPPASFSSSFERNFPADTLETIELELPDLQNIRQEDQENNWDNRFAIPIEVSIDLDSHGSWTDLPNGGRIWRLSIQASGAYGLSLLYQKFNLPPGAMLHVYGKNKQQVLGGYTSKNNPKTGRFFTGFISGESLTIEYYEPASVRGIGHFEIFRVNFAYRSNNFVASNNIGFGNSLDCQINVNCPEGEDWQEEKQSVCRILMNVEEGVIYCTGSLINNVRNDGTPYVLSAFHCQDGFTPLYDLWRFDFNYESATCNSPTEEPSFQSVLGCVRRAGFQDSDMLLLEITSVIPEQFNVFYSGWRKTEEVPEQAVHIHHPKADIKKIAIDDDQALIFPNSISWNNGLVTPPEHHFVINYDLGRHEIGSSGGPLFDQDHFIVGQLHGGIDTVCENKIAYFGRFYHSWTGGGSSDTRLMDWLDPDNTFVDTLSGMFAIPRDTSSISGYVRTEMGEGIAGVSIILTGSNGDTMTTDASGFYIFSGLPIEENYGIQLAKDGNDINGVNSLDMIRMRKHILNLELLSSPYALLASDVNDSGFLSTIDIIRISKLVLSIDVAFASVPSWRFFPANFIFPNPEDPFATVFPGIYHLNNLMDPITNFNFTGVKMGDVTGSADPGQ